MALLVKAGETTAARRRVYFQCVDASDVITAETGEAGGQPEISTNGGAWTSTGIGTLVAIGNGRYYAELTEAAVDTAGRVIESRYKSANTAEAIGTTVQVVGFDPAQDIPTANEVADQVWDELAGDHEAAGTLGELLMLVRAATQGKLTISADGTTYTFYKADGTTAAFTWTVAADKTSRAP